MKDIWNNDFCAFKQDTNGTLWLIWNLNSGNMTDDDFKEVLLKNADLATDCNAPNTAVDTREFRFSMGDELMKWRGQELFPKYIAAGIKKQAFLMPAGKPMMSSDGSKTGGILIESFTETEALSGWLN